jgi:hypothetical protein
MHRAAPSLNRSSLSRHLFPKNAVLASASMRMLANSSPEPGFTSGVERASQRCRAAACLAWSTKIIPISGMSEYRPFEVICTRPFRKTKRVEPWSTYVRDVRSLPREGPALERHCSAAATRLPCHHRESHAVQCDPVAGGDANARGQWQNSDAETQPSSASSSPLRFETLG